MKTSSSSREACSRPTRPVDAKALSAILQNVRSTAFRLETLQYYAGDDEELDEFRHGLPLRERSIETSPYLRRIAVATLAGRHWSRIHVIDQPLTDYVRFELASYIGSAAVGERIMIADRSGSPDLETLRQDFWLLDDGLPDETALLMDYADDGKFTGTRTADAATLDWCRRMRDTAARYAVPLNEYLASEGRRVA